MFLQLAELCLPFLRSTQIARLFPEWDCQISQSNALGYGVPPALRRMIGRVIRFRTLLVPVSTTCRDPSRLLVLFGCDNLFPARADKHRGFAQMNGIAALPWVAANGTAELY